MKIEFDNVFFIFLKIRDIDFIMLNKDIFNIQPNNYCQSPGWKQNTGVTIHFHVDEARTTINADPSVQLDTSIVFVNIL